MQGAGKKFTIKQRNKAEWNKIPLNSSLYDKSVKTIKFSIIQQTYERKKKLRVACFDSGNSSVKFLVLIWLEKMFEIHKRIGKQLV